MTLITLIVTLVIIGFLVYLAETYIPMSPPIKMALRVIVVIVLILWLLEIFGIRGPIVRLS